MAIKDILTAHGISAGELGKALVQSGGRFQGQPFSRSAMAQLINHGVVPKSSPDIQRQIETYLTSRGISPIELKTLWVTATPNHENEIMLPKKDTLSQRAMKHFKLRHNPFGDVEDDSEMFLSGNILDAKEALLDTMKHGGFMALVSESGAGKTTLLEDCEEHIRANSLPVTLIRPPINGIDTSKEKGSPLRARSILMLILDAVAPMARRYADLSRLTVEVNRQLAERKTGQQSFCLVIDDAHRLSGSTLNHLKDFYELKVGRKRLLGIVLLGQPQLGDRLDPHNPDLIQITQRCKIEALPPLDKDSIRAYLDQRLRAAGSAADKIFADNAYDAIQAQLTVLVHDSKRKHAQINRSYPLAVNNTVIRAMNLAAESKDDKVYADTIKGA